MSYLLRIIRFTLILNIFGYFKCASQDLPLPLPDLLPKVDYVSSTFKSDNIVNAQSNETLYRHELRFNVSHRFDDIAGSFGGIKSFFGLENSTDVKIGFDYGITNRLTVGISRVKGSPELRNGNIYFNSLSQLCVGSLKYKLLRQTTTDNMPLSVSLYGNAMLSTRPSLNDSTSDAHFTNFSDRLSFVTQVIITRKFSRNISIAVLPTFIRRNFVSFMDRNNLFALGIGGRLKINNRIAVIFDYFLPFRSPSTESYYKFQNVHFYNPLAIGLEIETGGHVFHINFSNSTAILENQFIPYTTRSWIKGEFRLGFNISRSFTLFLKKDRT